MHTVNDLINAFFEVGGSLAAWVNVFKLYRDKQVRGVYWPASLFFTLWGLWNLYYYPTLGQWASFWGGAFMCTSNIAWIILAIKYTNAEKENP
jgi:hypothetical protein